MNNVIPLRPDPLHEEFRKWYSEPTQEELRKGCAEGWAFKIWQASRKNIVIDTGYLLGDGENEDSDYTLGFNQGITKADRAIRAAGLQVKDSYPGLASKYSEDSDNGEDDLPAS